MAGRELIKEADKHLDKLKNIDLTVSGKRCQEELADQSEIMKDELRYPTRILRNIFFVNLSLVVFRGCSGAGVSTFFSNVSAAEMLRLPNC